MSEAEIRDKKDSSMRNIVLGLGMIGCGIYAYSMFTQMEQSGGSRRLPMLIISLYRAFGKMGVLAGTSALGALLIFWGVRDLIKKRSAA